VGAFAPGMPVGTLNVALSNFMQKHTNGSMVQRILAPDVPVDRQAFQYVVFDRSSQRNDRTTLRAPGSRPQSVRMNYSVDPYFCHSHALEGNVPFEQQAYAAGLGFNEEEALVAFLTDRLLLDTEVAVASLALNPAVIPNNQTLSGASMWDSYLTGGVSHPILVVEQAKSIIRQSGIDPNFMVLSDPVYSALTNHPDITARFAFLPGGTVIGLTELSSVFKIPVYKASAVVLDKNDVGSWVWGESCVLGYSQATPGMADVSAMKKFNWTAAPGTAGGYGVLTFPDPYLNKKTTISSIDNYYDIRVTATDTIYTFNGCVQVPAFGEIAAPIFG
jgi:hypothetical protein